MKIAIVAKSTFPIREPFVGGLEKITFLLCRALIERGHKVDFYGHPDSDSRLNVLVLPYAARFDTELFDRLSKKEGMHVNNVREQLGYIQVMNKIQAGDYDLIHNHAQHYIPIIMGNLLNVPMITSIHTPPIARIEYGNLGIQENSQMSYTMVSESLAESWSRYIPYANVVHNGIEMEEWPFVEYPNGDYLCWFGRICEEKGTHLAIKVAKAANLPLKIAGMIYDSEYFDEFVLPHLDNESISYMGHLGQSDIAPLIGNARAMLFTSIWEEPFGLTLIESLACGTPVIAFNGGAVPEILDKSCGIVVPNGNIENMASAIEKVATISRRACRSQVEHRFSYNVMTDNYLDIYYNLITEHKFLNAFIDDRILRA